MRFLFVLAVALVISIGQADDCSKDSCSNSETCCPGPSPGQFGCCAQPNAVCCSDGLHCCPTDTVCNLSEGKCDSNNVTIPFIFRKKPENIVKERNVASELQVAATELQAETPDKLYCPGCKSYCPIGNTCCRTPFGKYTCCPYPTTSCCCYGFQCCRRGSLCKGTSSQHSVNVIVPFISRKKSQPIVKERKVAPAEGLEEVDIVHCPGGKFFCPSRHTCCRSPYGQFTCCPYPATKCCCYGYHCCRRGSPMLPGLTKLRTTTDIPVSSSEN